MWPFLPKLSTSGVAIISLPFNTRHGLTVVAWNPERPAWVCLICAVMKPLTFS